MYSAAATDLLIKRNGLPQSRHSGKKPMYYVEGSHEAIIAKDIFLQVQAEIAEEQTSRRMERREFIAAGTHFSVSCSVVTAEISTAGSSGTTGAASQRYGDALAEF